MGVDQEWGGPKGPRFLPAPPFLTQIDAHGKPSLSVGIIMPGKSTMESIFILRLMVEKQRAAKRRLNLGFVDVENAYDVALRSKLWDALRKNGVGSGYIRKVQGIYRGARTMVNTA